MQKQRTMDSLKRIRKLVEKGGTPLFFMAVAHLFECGMSSFAEESYASGIKSIEENHRQAEKSGRIRFSTPDYEKSVLAMAYQLSKFQLFDVLLYIKKHMEIEDPEAAESEEEFDEEE